MRTVIRAAIGIGVVAIATTSLAGESWKETYSGIGAGGSHGDACAVAKANAQATSMAACLVRKGRRADENFRDCNCQGDPVATCTVTLVVMCEK